MPEEETVDIENARRIAITFISHNLFNTVPPFAIVPVNVWQCMVLFDTLK